MCRGSPGRCVQLADRIYRVFSDEIITTALEGNTLILYVEDDEELVRRYVEDLAESEYVEVRRPPVEISVLQNWQDVATEVLLEAELLTHIAMRITEGALTIWVTDEDKARDIIASLGIPPEIKVEIIEGAGLQNQ